MGWEQKKGAVERVVEAVAALILGAATAYAVFVLAPLAGSALAAFAATGGAAAGASAFALLRRVDAPGDDGPGFSLVDFEEAISTTPATGDAIDADELLLDDPIGPAAPNSRVVQLFGVDPLPEPGELVTRIADYLKTDRIARSDVSRPAPGEASAALHAALADIRRSLR